MALRFLPDIDELVAPLSGDSPGGGRTAFSRLQLEVKKLDTEDDDPDLYWGKVVRLCQPVLKGEAKDLRIARWVVNALPRREVVSDRNRSGKPSGFEALADTLTLLRRLTEEGWEYVHPQADPDEPDPEYRNAPFEWLGMAGEGACLPDFVQRMPLVRTGSGTLSELDWREAKDEARELADKVVSEAQVGPLEAVRADIDRGLGEIKQIDDLLYQKLEGSAPSLVGLRDALSACRHLADGLLDKKTGGRSAAANDDPEPVEDESAPSDAPRSRSPRAAAGGRDEAYAQVREAAALIARLEPHSPVPYLLNWAVSLQNLSFPEMLKAIDTAGEAAPALFKRLNIAEPEST